MREQESGGLEDRRRRKLLHEAQAQSREELSQGEGVSGKGEQGSS